MMAVYDQDQPAAGPMVVGGIQAVATATALKAVAPANSVYVFNSAYGFHWGQGPIAFRRGFAYTLDARLKAALLAANAPMAAA